MLKAFLVLVTLFLSATAQSCQCSSFGNVPPTGFSGHISGTDTTNVLTLVASGVYCGNPSTGRFGTACYGTVVSQEVWPSDSCRSDIAWQFTLAQLEQCPGVSVRNDGVSGMFSMNTYPMPVPNLVGDYTFVAVLNEPLRVTFPSQFTGIVGVEVVNLPQILSAAVNVSTYENNVLTIPVIQMLPFPFVFSAQAGNTVLLSAPNTISPSAVSTTVFSPPCTSAPGNPVCARSEEIRITGQACAMNGAYTFQVGISQGCPTCPIPPSDKMTFQLNVVTVQQCELALFPTLTASVTATSANGGAQSYFLANTAILIKGQTSGAVSVRGMSMTLDICRGSLPCVNGAPNNVRLMVNNVAQLNNANVSALNPIVTVKRDQVSMLRTWDASALPLITVFGRTTPYTISWAIKTSVLVSGATRQFQDVMSFGSSSVRAVEDGGGIVTFDDTAEVDRVGSVPNFLLVVPAPLCHANEIYNATTAACQQCAGATGLEMTCSAGVTSGGGGPTDPGDGPTVVPGSVNTVNIGLIAGCAAGGAAVLIGAIIVAVYCKYKRAPGASATNIV